MASKTESKIKTSSKAKAGYYLADGTRIPGVTTILGEIAKPALIEWAWKLGIQGINYREYRDSLADIGSLAHDMILCHLRGIDPDPSSYSPDQVKCAEWCFASYLAWERQVKIEPVLIEESLVSELNRYGGRADFVGYVNGKLTLLDFKTGGIYQDHFYQLAGYSALINEVHPELGNIEQYVILGIPRAESEAFKQETKVSLAPHWKIFQAALVIYTTKKEIPK